MADDDTVDVASQDPEGSSEQVDDTALQGDTDATEESSTGTDSSGEPDVDYKAQLEQERAAREHAENIARSHQSARDREAAELADYRRKEAERKAAEDADKDRHIDRISDPKTYREMTREEARAEVRKEMDVRDWVLREQQARAEGAEAWSDFQKFAYEEAKLTPEQFQAFLTRNASYGENGKNLGLFPGYPPKEQLRLSKALLRDQEFSRFADKTREAADKDADAKAKHKLKTALPGGQPPGGPEPPKTPEEAYREAVRTPATSEPDNWVK
jgi:hypothetical protein